MLGAANCQFSPKYAVIGSEASAEELKLMLALVAQPRFWLALKAQLYCLCHRGGYGDSRYCRGGGFVAVFGGGTNGQKVLLANKESLVMAGPLFMKPSKGRCDFCCPSTANTTPFSVFASGLSR